jgi:hypothetical protein
MSSRGALVLIAGAIAAPMLMGGCARPKAAAPPAANSEPPAAIAAGPAKPEPASTAANPAAAPGSALEGQHVQPPPAGLRELFPSIRADVAGGLIEFDGIVPINCHDAATPDVYLELIACTPDTREHESLVVTRARPSHLHAALLAIGVKPGEPGSWKVENKKLIALPPRGDALDVRVAYQIADGSEIERPICEWVIAAGTHSAFQPRDASAPRWLFAGSLFVKRRGGEVYDADGSGTVIGLTTFGSEVVAWPDTISPEAEIDEPEWIADPKKVPAAGTAVIVRIRPAKP